MEKGSRLRSREGLAIVIVLVVVLAGCGGSPPVGGQEIAVEEGTDRDCDGYYQSFQLTTDVRIGTDSAASGDAWVGLSYKVTGGEFESIETFDDLSGWRFQEDIVYSASDFNNERTTIVLHATAKRSTLLGSETVSQGKSNPINVEPAGEDESGLEPSFSQDPTKPNRTETMTLTAGTGDSQCPVEAYEWDIDGDGSFEETGAEIALSYSTDGRRDVTLRVTDAGGTTKEVTEEVLVFHDPDSDGVTTAREERWGTDPRDWDTDGDLFSDQIDPAPNVLLIPTAAIQGALAGALYLGGVLYRNELRQWSTIAVRRGRTLRGQIMVLVRNPATGAQVVSRNLRSWGQVTVERISRWIDRLR